MSTRTCTILLVALVLLAPSFALASKMRGVLITMDSKGPVLMDGEKKGKGPILMNDMKKGKGPILMDGKKKK